MITRYAKGVYLWTMDSTTKHPIQSKLHNWKRLSKTRLVVSLTWSFDAMSTVANHFLILTFIPVVFHESASKECKRKLAEAYALNHKLNGSVSEQDLFNLRRKLEEDESQKSKSRNLKQKLIIPWAKNIAFQAKYCS